MIAAWGGRKSTPSPLLALGKFWAGVWLVCSASRTFLMATVSYPHIELAADGTALVEGTRTKVVEIALDRLAHHWDAEEIQRQHPHLTLAQIYAALTYYRDHRQHFDSEIRDQLKDVDLIASRQEPSLVREKLRNAGENP